MNEEDFDLEKIMKGISEAWKETKEFFGIEGEVDAIVKVPGWKDMNIKVK